MLEVKNIGKVYGSGKNAFRALENVNINFGSKGLVIILGKSGCGKSTLLNIIGGLDTPTEGEVIINGRSTKKFKRSEFDAYRNTFVGIVFQEFNLIDDISVFDNINMTMKIQEKNTDVNTVDEALAMVGLQNLGYRKPSELSGGQRQRVSLARALLKKPEIILADEPTGALDSATGEEVFETLKKIALDKLVIVVTHNRDLANTYGDRIVEISDGKIVSDKVRAEGDKSAVKELPGGVIEVASTGEITAEALNAKLAKSKTNYIGLSHDKDRIALAYPETVDSFYSQGEAVKFNDTEAADIPTDNKEFRLSKGGITFKESMKLARGNIKRHKKRFRFINVISTFCFMFIALGLMVGMVSVPNIVAETAFDTDSTLVQAARFTDTDSYYAAPSKLTSEQTEKIKNIVGEKLGYGVRLFATPELAVEDNNAPTQASYNNWSGVEGSYEVSYDFSYFNGVIEVSDITDLGMQAVAGATKCTKTNEIIISDFAAYMLGKKGFIGTDKNGKMDVHYLPDVESIVGYSVNIKQTEKLYKIVGVFKTGYQEYAAIASGTAQFNSDINDLRTEFTSLHKYEYRKLFGCAGLAKEFTSSGSSIAMNLKKGEQYKLYNSDINTGTMAYEKDNITTKPHEYEKPRLVWAKEKNSADEYVIPDTLTEKQVILSFDLVRNLTERWDVSSAEALISSSEFNTAINAKYTVEFTGKYGSGSIMQVEEMEIVGMVEGGYGSGGYSVMFNKETADRVIAAGGGYEYVYFPRDGVGSLESTVTALKDAGFSTGTAVADAASLTGFDETLKTLAQVFLYIALAMFVFAFFIIFNYISTSVRFRTKEIAVYRVIGAKSTDIAKIFLAEGAGIVIRTSIAAIVLSFLISLLLDSILGSVMGAFGITFTLIRFNWLVEPLAIILGSALTVALSSLIPVWRITSKRPVEAVKMI